MRRLVQIILFTPDVDAMRSFYEEGLGLRPIYAGPRWTSYRTAGLTLALHPLEGGHEREVELTFASADVHGDAGRLEARGVLRVGGVQQQSYGTTAQLRDPDGNLLALRQGGDSPGDGGPLIGTVVLHVRDLAVATAFYRDQLGLDVTSAGPHSAELEAGGVRLVLQARSDGPRRSAGAARPLAICFETLDLESWVEEIEGREVRFATSPTEGESGLFAEAHDPDGNVLVFRETAPPDSLEDELASEFDEDAPTHAVAMRRPVKKGSKAVSRLAVKPDYHERKPARKPLSGTTRAVASTRGAGPDHTRLKPKRTSDEKKAKVKPAIGRLKKAERVSASRQRSARATASKGRPVKRASASKGRSQSSR